MHHSSKMPEGTELINAIPALKGEAFSCNESKIGPGLNPLRGGCFVVDV